MTKVFTILAAFMLCGFIMKAQVPVEEFNHYIDGYSNKEQQKTFSEQQKQWKQELMESSSRVQKNKSATTENYFRDSALSYPWDANLNSWVTTPYGLSKNEYNENGLISTYRFYYWESAANSWVVSYEYLYVYDANGNMTEWIMNTYDANTNTWTPYEHDYFIYNNNILISDTWNYYNTLTDTWFIGEYWHYNDAGALTEEYHIRWNSATFVISGGYKNTYTLNSSNQPIEDIYQSFDVSAQAMINVIKTVSTYQNDITLVEDVTYNWDNTNETWFLVYQSQYTYTNNLKSEQLQKYWDGSQWLNDSRYTFEYNSNLLITKELGQYWNGSDWSTNIQNLFTYNSNNNFTEKLYQKYKDGGWVNRYLYSYSYDNNNNITEDVYKSWDTETGLVTYGTKYNYTFDANNCNKQTIYQKWSVANNDWLNNRKTDYYYSIHSFVGLNALSEQNIEVFPNPATNNLFVIGIPEKAALTIYNMGGKLLYSSHISNSQINISGLPTGIYALRIETKKGLVTKKFVKQ